MSPFSCCKNVHLINERLFGIVPLLALGFSIGELIYTTSLNGPANLEIIGTTSTLILLLSSALVLIHFRFGLFIFTLLTLSASILVSSIHLLTSLEPQSSPLDLILNGTRIRWILKAQLENDCCGYYNYTDWIKNGEIQEGIVSCCNRTSQCSVDIDQDWGTLVSQFGCAEKLDQSNENIINERVKSASGLLFFDGILTIEFLFHSIWSKLRRTSMSNDDIDGDAVFS